MIEAPKVWTVSEIGQVAILLPIIHVIMTALHLWGFAIGYGANIAAMMSATDLVRLGSIGMVLLYSVLLLFVLQVLGQDLIMESPIVKSVYDSRYWYSSFDLPFYAASIVALFKIIVSVYHQAYFTYVLILVVLFPVIKYFIVMASKRGVPRRLLVAIVVLSSPALLSLFIGTSFGRDIRTTEYVNTSANTSTILCQGADVIPKILYPIGDNYIAVLPSDRQVIVNEECKVLFTVPERILKDASPTYPFTRS